MIHFVIFSKFLDEIEENVASKEHTEYISFEMLLSIRQSNK